MPHVHALLLEIAARYRQLHYSWLLDLALKGKRGTYSASLAGTGVVTSTTLGAGTGASGTAATAHGRRIK